MADNRAVAEVFTFPTDISQFDDDERISFSKLDGKYIAVQDDGTEFEFDQALKRWIPLADNDDEDPAAFAAAQQQAAGAWGEHDDGGTRNDADPRLEGRKRKADRAHYKNEPQDRNGAGPNLSNKRAKAQPGGAPRQPKQNTAVYVTGLPLDATADEVAELFSRKCGVIAEEIDSGRPRIKMYTDAAGRFKGDALVVFFKPQSVNMAIMLLDDTDFRLAPASAGSGGGRMRVQAADSSYKKTNYQSEAVPAAGDGDGGGPSAAAATAAAAAEAAAATAAAAAHAAAAGPGGRGRQSNQDKQKIIKKTQKLDAKLADWSSDEDERFAGRIEGSLRGGAGRRSAKWDKVVVLKHMFTLAELEEDPAALLDIKEDIREECSKLGEVTNVVLFDEEPAGIVSVKFKTPEAAAACVRLMGGRAFDGRIVEATLATGREKYRRSKKGNDDDNDSDDDGSDGGSSSKDGSGGN